MTDPSAQLLRHLKENEDLTRHLLEAMPGGVVHVGLDGAIHFANGEAQRLLGLSHDALAQRFVVDFAPLTWFENGQPCPVEDYPVSRCLATGEPQRDVTIGVQLPHGDMSWAVFSAVPLRDPATGQQTGALVTFLDITHRIATEKKLAASEAQYRRIVDTATEGITTMDPDLRITFVNKRMCELVGYTADELIGRDAREIALPTRRDKAEHRASQLRNGESLLVEAPVRHKQGHEVWLLIAATPILDPDGSHAGVLTMCADLTSHKQMEAALRDAEKMRAVGQLAGGVAHDFNNQLTAIRGFAELLLEMLDEASVEATHARTIIRAASRAGSLTHQLLAFARRGKYQHVTVDLHELIDELIVLLQRSIGPEVRIRRQSAPGAAFTIGDPDQLHNALLNISLNARDAMPGGGDLTFRTRTIGIESGDARLGG
ncbi:MAG: PAS domain S-box protein, partial [Planctomycetota bacterium]